MTIFSSIRSSEFLRSRYENAKNSAATVNWWNVLATLIFGISLLFLILGLVWLSKGDENVTKTWVFFSLGLCGTLLGISYFIWKFTPKFQITKPTSRRRHRRHTHRSDRVWATPQSIHTHTHVHHTRQATTTSMPSPRPCEASRDVSAAPPTYDEAMGVNRASVVIENTPPPYGRPAR